MKLIPALQPIINFHLKAVVGHEVLARWVDGNDRNRILLPSNVDIPWQETDMRVLGFLLKVCDVMPIDIHHLFINVSEETLFEDQCFELWKQRLSRLLHVASYEITIEIVESVCDGVLKARWEALKGLGVTLAIDDFGEHYAGTERLRTYSWNYCKFSLELLQTDEAIQAVNYCKVNNVIVIAERVETIQDQKTSNDYGAIYHQGFFYSKPVLFTDLCRLESKQC